MITFKSITITQSEVRPRKSHHNLILLLFPDSLLMTTTGSISGDDQTYIRKEHHLVARAVDSSQDLGAVHYQQFLAERGVEGEKRKPEEKNIGRSVISSYLAYKVKTPDGSLIYLPIIKGWINIILFAQKYIIEGYSKPIKFCHFLILKA